MFSLIVWIFAACLLLLSFLKNKEKTAKSLKVSWKFFSSMALLVLITIWTIGFLLAFLPPEVISHTVGPDFAGLRLALTIPSILAISWVLNAILSRSHIYE